MKAVEALALVSGKIEEELLLRNEYADDAIIHCQTGEEAKRIKDALSDRMKRCGLELHPEKTRIVYCKDDNLKSHAKTTQFDFLGFTFRMRTVRNQCFTSSYWLSYKQAQELDGKVKKDEKNTMVTFWKLGNRLNEAGGKESYFIL